jgi:hypothetical protein
MAKLGYWPDKRLPIKVAARYIAGYRDPAIILIDQLQGDRDRRRSTPSRPPTGSTQLDL